MEGRYLGVNSVGKIHSQNDHESGIDGEIIVSNIGLLFLLDFVILLFFVDLEL